MKEIPLTQGRVALIDDDDYEVVSMHTWSLFKRTLRGTYVNCDVDHLDSYLDEQTFRFNNRVGNDAERFSLVLGSVAGKRLTYKQLIIKKTFKQLNFFRKLI